MTGQEYDAVRSDDTVQFSDTTRSDDTMQSDDAMQSSDATQSDETKRSGMGDLQELGSDHPLSLSGSDRSWHIVRGTVEVFAVAGAGKADLPRLHMMTAGSGETLFGLDHSLTGTFRLIAVGGPGSAVQVGQASEEPGKRRHWLRELARAGRSRAGAAFDDHSGGSPEPKAATLEALLTDAIAERRSALDEEDAARVHAQRVNHQGALADGIETLGALLGRDDADLKKWAEENALIGAFRAVARAQGIQVTLPPPGADDEDPLTSVARASGVRTRAVSLSGDWWRQDCGTVLGFLRDGHRPIALVAPRPGRYELVDTASGIRQRVGKQLAATVEPSAFAVYRPLPAGPVSIRQLLQGGLTDVRADLFRLILISLAMAVLALVVPIVTGQIIGSVIPQSDRPELLQLSIALVVAAIAGSLFQATSAIAVLRIQGRFDRYLGPAIWGRLLSLPTAFFRRYSAGDLAFRVLSIESIVQLISGTAVTSLLGAVFSVFSFGLIWFYSVQLGLVATGLLIVLIALLALAGRLQLRRQRIVEQISGKLSGMLLEFVSAIGKLRTAGAQERAFQRWAIQFTEKRMRWNSVRTMENVVTVITGAFPLVSSIALFAVVGLARPVSVSPAVFLAVNAAYLQVLVAVLTMAQSMILLLRAVPGLQRISPILAEQPEDDLAKADPGTLRGDVEFSRVSFRYYPEGPLVLDDVSIRVPAGSVIALVGPSGSGKSTLGRLLLGFEEPDDGAVFFDDQDLSGLDLRAVRRQLGVVLQSVQLLPGTIQSNIIGSAVGLTIDDAWQAASDAGLADDLRDMPMGMHTSVSEGGATLSGGQRQRLLIARALAGSPRILLFDEATSALDNTTQAVVAESLARVNATRILIAHRLSTVIGADRIYYLENGRVVEAGNYEELMAIDGKFASQARRQLS